MVVGQGRSSDQHTLRRLFGSHRLLLVLPARDARHADDDELVVFDVGGVDAHRSCVLRRAGTQEISRAGGGEGDCAYGEAGRVALTIYPTENTISLSVFRFYYFTSY